MNEDNLEKEKKELLNLNRLWRNTQELELEDDTLVKMKKKILFKISQCEKRILDLQRST